MHIIYDVSHNIAKIEEHVVEGNQDCPYNYKDEIWENLFPEDKRKYSRVGVILFELFWGNY